MQKIKELRFALIGFFLLLFLFGCKTKIDGFIPEPFAMLQDDANLFACLPTKNNEDLLKSIIFSFGKEEFKLDFELDNSINEIVERSNYIYLGPSSKYIDLVIEGSFPKKYESLVFTKKNGWKKNTHPVLGNWYRQDNLFIAIPYNNIVIAQLNYDENADGFVNFLNRCIPRNEEFNPIEYLNKDFIEKTKKENIADTIAISFLNKEFFEKAIFNIVLELAIDDANLYANKVDDNYLINVDLYFKNPSIAKRMASLLSFVLKLNVKDKDNMLSIKEISMSTDEMVEIITNF